jgi:hypothetical protein
MNFVRHKAAAATNRRDGGDERHSSAANARQPG